MEQEILGIQSQMVANYISPNYVLTCIVIRKKLVALGFEFLSLIIKHKKSASVGLELELS